MPFLLLFGVQFSLVAQDDGLWLKLVARHLDSVLAAETVDVKYRVRNLFGDEQLFDIECQYLTRGEKIYHSVPYPSVSYGGDVLQVFDGGNSFQIKDSNSYGRIMYLDSKYPGKARDIPVWDSPIGSWYRFLNIESQQNAFYPLSLQELRKSDFRDAMAADKVEMVTDEGRDFLLVTLPSFYSGQMGEACMARLWLDLESGLIYRQEYGDFSKDGERREMYLLKEVMEIQLDGKKIQLPKAFEWQIWDGVNDKPFVRSVDLFRFKIRRRS